MIPISINKIVRIHVLKSHLKLSDDSYRDILSGFGVSSSKLLDEVGGVHLIMALEKLLNSQIANSGRPHPQFKKKYDELADRPGMASPKQIRLIEAMWYGVSYHKDSERRQDALNAFIMRICGISAIEWLEPKHISMLVNALQRMKKQSFKKEVINEYSTGN